MKFKVICTERNNYEVAYEKKIFAGGEVHVKIGRLPVGYYGDVVIDGIPDSSESIMELIMLADALSRLKATGKISAYIHYLPYARQDRVCTPGESFALESFINLIGQCNINEVIVDDVHSQVAKDLCKKPGLFADFIFKSQIQLIGRWIENNTYTIIAPDAGAFLKAESLALSSKNEFAAFEKKRDLNTGKITDTIMSRGYSLIEGKDCLIVDDLVDYGGTFIPIANDLINRGAKTVNLVVTHLVLPVSPERIIASGIDNIFYVNKFNDDLGEDDNIFHVSKLSEIFARDNLISNISI